MSSFIRIFDTTLRDGEQSPGFSMNTKEKIQVAKHLDRLGVDTIEAGFPVTSPDDFQAVSQIAEIVENAEVCALARCAEKDLDIAIASIKKAQKPVIHTFVATSPIHRDFKLKKSKEEVIEMAIKGVKHAKSAYPKVIFSPEDGSRTEPKFLYEVLQNVLEAGATVLNIPDTVGYSTPEEFKNLIQGIFTNVVKPWNANHASDVIISTHCQNDLGLATANSLAGILGGAKEIQCTINGIGERAGNASLEEVVMAIETRADFYEFRTKIKTKEIYPISKLIQTITGVPVQPNKAIVGANAFAHESGIHQDGVLKHRQTYEIMNASDIGLDQNKLVLGKHSGRHALKVRLQELGYLVDETKIENIYIDFKNLADKKKEVFDQDLHLLMGYDTEPKNLWQIHSLETSSSTNKQPQAKVSLKILSKYLSKQLTKKWKGLNLDQKIENNFTIIASAQTGDGQVDAAFQAINNILQAPAEILLQEYSVNAVTQGIDAQATVNVRAEYKHKIFTASASDTDVIVASCKAYLGCLNKVFSQINELQI